MKNILKQGWFVQPKSYPSSLFSQFLLISHKKQSGKYIFSWWQNVFSLDDKIYFLLMAKGVLLSVSLDGEHWVPTKRVTIVTIFQICNFYCFCLLYLYFPFCIFVFCNMCCSVCSFLQVSIDGEQNLYRQRGRVTNPWWQFASSCNYFMNDIHNSQLSVMSIYSLKGKASKWKKCF